MNKLKLTKKDADQIRFAEHMGGFFHDFLRAAGITMTPGNAMERVRSIGEKMGKAISDQAEKKSVQIIEQLQANVIAGFVKMEESFNKVKDLQTSTSAALLNVIEDMKQNQTDIKDLRWRLQKLENDSNADKQPGETLN
jgi:hypothetical protein